YRNAGLVDLHDRLRGLDHRRDDAAGQQHEGDNGADIHRVLVDQREVNRDGDDAICHQYLKRMHNGLHPIRQEPLGIALFGDIGAMHIPLVALPRIERQRLHRPDAVDRLDEERAAPRLGRRDGADPPPDAGSIATSQPQISRDSTRTQTVIIVLKKNMTGRKNTMTSASSAVPNSCVVRKPRILPISWKLWTNSPVELRS